MRILTPFGAATILLAEPIFGALMAFTLYGVTPTAAQSIAALVIVAAIYLSLRDRTGVANNDEVD